MLELRDLTRLIHLETTVKTMKTLWLQVPLDGFVKINWDASVDEFNVIVRDSMSEALTTKATTALWTVNFAWELRF